jgi:hypothetical protein
MPFPVIPAEAGIQGFQKITKSLDPVFQRGDESHVSMLHGNTIKIGEFYVYKKISSAIAISVHFTLDSFFQHPFIQRRPKPCSAWSRH